MPAMARKARYAPGGLTYHVLNRAVARYPIFKTDKDHRAFQEIIIEAAERHSGVKLLVIGGTVAHSRYGLVADRAFSISGALVLAVTHYFNSRRVRHCRQ